MSSSYIVVLKFRQYVFYTLFQLLSKQKEKRWKNEIENKSLTNK